TLIEDGDNYYYVDINGVMASNQWVAIDNEDAGEDDEPEHYWYYFQANGKALKNSGDNVSLKTINGKKYAFDDEGKMLYGWVANDNAERIDNTDGDAFKDGIYYFGGEDDGAMTVGWLQMDITYEEATNDEYKFVAPVFTDDEDQSRWFYFKSNGKKIYADNGEETKEKTINGKKYAFDQNGAMVAEWSMDETKVATADMPATPGKASTAKYSQAWRYFNSVEDGSRVSKGWFKVVSAEYLNEEKYNDDEDAWYYADGSGNLYAGEFKTIKGKKYAFRNDGRMINGLKFINKNDLTKVYADDDNDHPFDTEDDFIDSALWYTANGYSCYYFGGGDDGAMKTNKTSISIDGDNFNFYFEKSGSDKGAGVNGEKDDKYYLGGMLLKAGSDDKYQAIQYVDKAGEEKGWKKLDDAQAVIDLHNVTSDVSPANVDAAKKAASSFNKKVDDLKELYVLPDNELKLINTSGKVIDKKGKSKDGNDYVYVTDNKGVIRVIYVED
ncbi:argininosuccinate lyase, partial [Enterocloster citroniae]